MLNIYNLRVHTSTYKNLYLGGGWQGTKQPWPGPGLDHQHLIKSHYSINSILISENSLTVLYYYFFFLSFFQQCFITRT